MNKIISVLMLTVWALHAQDISEERKSSLVLLRAVNEFKALNNTIKAQIEQEAQTRPGSVPDFFGVNKDECLLPEGLTCCEDATYRDAYLNTIIPEERMRSVLALNLFGILSKKQDAAELRFFCEDYNITKFRIEGNDVHETK
jgi:hypothetical protein